MTLTLSFPVEWKRARLGGEKPAPPVKWCAVMFNDKYRIIYLKCPKTAGTPLIYYFGERRGRLAAGTCGAGLG